MAIKNARIRKASLGIEDHGIMTCMLYLDYQGSAQGFGGYSLDTYDDTVKRRVGTAYGMEWIIRLLRAVGVDNWEDLVGQNVRVDGDYTKIKRIGHIIEENWFDPDEIKDYVEPKRK
jgi:hypothetical protein